MAAGTRLNNLDRLHLALHSPRNTFQRHCPRIDVQTLVSRIRAKIGRSATDSHRIGPRLPTTTTSSRVERRERERGERGGERKRDSPVSRVSSRVSGITEATILLRRASNRWPTAVPPPCSRIDSPDSAPAQLHPLAHPIVSTGGDTTTSNGPILSCPIDEQYNIFLNNNNCPRDFQ